MFVASFKWSNLTRWSLYLESIISFVTATLPIDVADTGFFMMGQINMIYVNFALCYFSWWPSLALSMCVLIPFSISRLIYFDESAALLATAGVF